MFTCFRLDYAMLVFDYAMLVFRILWITPAVLINQGLQRLYLDLGFRQTYKR